ncbi:MAG: FmdB family transcriptional regulator, partial [Rhodocyclales bacterium CG_4_10_14_3_um_filter_68_10]
MPIYEYRCNACGFQKEYLRKRTDAPLTECPECGGATLEKMLSAGSFQLKGK